MSRWQIGTAVGGFTLIFALLGCTNPTDLKQQAPPPPPPQAAPYSSGFNPNFQDTFRLLATFRCSPEGAITRPLDEFRDEYGWLWQSVCHRWRSRA